MSCINLYLAMERIREDESPLYHVQDFDLLHRTCLIQFMEDFFKFFYLYRLRGGNEGTKGTVAICYN